jgi:hypothetical protein
MPRAQKATVHRGTPTRQGEERVTIRTRVGAALAATTLLTSGTIAATTTAANAASFTFTFRDYQFKEVDVYKDGTYAGRVVWYPDPYSGGYSKNGDTLCVHDASADGWGLEATLSDGRKVSTRGHTSGYYECQSGDLPEGSRYTMYAYAVKGDSTHMSNPYQVYA